jgi:lipoate-protein ligase A
MVEAEGRQGSWNMALDHALAERLRPGTGVLRLYAWSPHAVSFGRNEPALGVYDPAAAAGEGVDFVRRPTGGRAVLHAWEVTYCAVFGVRVLGGGRDAYVRVSEGLVAGLTELGCPAQVSRAGSVLPPDAGPCFQAPAPGEVVLHGRKLVGSAQVRIGDAILQHGSVILRGDQALVARLAGGEEDPSPPATLEGAVGAVAWREAAGALATGMALALGGAWNEGGATPGEESRARELEKDRYATHAWTWRR